MLMKSPLKRFSRPWILCPPRFKSSNAASHVKAEAAALKIRAKELRSLDGDMVEIVRNSSKVPQDC